MPKTSRVDPCKVKCLKVFHLPPPFAAPILSGDLAFCCNPQKYSGSLRESHLKRQLNGESANIGSTWPRIESFTVHHALASSICVYIKFSFFCGSTIPGFSVIPSLTKPSHLLFNQITEVSIHVWCFFFIFSDR